MNTIISPLTFTDELVVIPAAPLIRDGRAGSATPDRESLAPFSTTNLLAAWARAIRQGRSDRAAIYRRLLEDLAGEEPTWEDAEWR